MPTKDSCYVYLYRDPLDHMPVYAGKGKGLRAFSHVQSSARTNPRLKNLRQARKWAGFSVEPEILLVGTEDCAHLRS